MRQLGGNDGLQPNNPMFQNLKAVYDYAVSQLINKFKETNEWSPHVVSAVGNLTEQELQNKVLVALAQQRAQAAKEVFNWAHDNRNKQMFDLNTQLSASGLSRNAQGYFLFHTADDLYYTKGLKNDNSESSDRDWSD